MKSKHIIFITLLFCAYVVNAQNNSITLDGTEEYIELPTGIANHDNFTFEAWVYWEGPTSDTWQRIMDFGNSSTEGNMFITPCADDNYIRFAITPNTYLGENKITSSTPMPLNEWHHIAVTISASGIGTLYLDGIVIGTNNNVMLPSALGNTPNNWLGKSQYVENPYFDGKLDEVRIWTTARTQTEIRANMYTELEGAESGLVAYYKINETQGVSNTTLPCSAATPQNAVLVDMDDENLLTSPAFYGPGNCLEFDGSDDFVACGNLPAGLNDITVEAWVKPDQYGAYNQYIFGEWGTPFRAQFTYNMNIGDDYKINFFNPTFGTQGGGTRISSQTALNDGKWHHVAWVDSADIKFICIDGVKEVSGSSNNAIYDGMISHIGGSNQGTNDNFDGCIDEVRVWNYARSQNDIIENMNKQLTGNETGLIAYYNFNNGNISTLQDFSPNALDGSLQNMEASSDWVDSDAYTTWLNTTSTSWGTAINWSRGSIPDADDNVGIYTNADEYQPVADDNLECNNLVIATATTFEIENSSHRTIHGSVWNIFDTKIKDNAWLSITGSLYMLHNSEIEIYPTAKLDIDKNLHTRYLGLDGTMTIKSDATGTGSLIVDGSSDGNVTFERYFPGGSNAWHTYSAPVNSVSISDSDFDPGTGTENDFYAWYEPEPGIWVNFKNQDGSGDTPSFPTANGGNNFKNGKGYLVAYNQATPTKTIAGDINTDDVEFTLENSGTKKTWTYVTGWNLMGNPFSSAISWTDAISDQSSLLQDAFAYAYDQSAYEGAGNYVYINGSWASQTIASQQGFFVIAQQTANSQPFTFEKDYKTHENSNIYKNKNTQYDIELSLTSDRYMDETTIYVTNNSTTNRDFYDALKLFSFNEKSPGIYSISSDNIKLAVNSLPSLSESTIINLGIKIPETATYTLSANYINTEIVENDLYLEDKFENIYTNLSNGDYTFSSIDGNFDNRFALHFKAVGISESIPNYIKVFSYNNNINIINNDNLTGMVIITNILGQEITSFKLNGNSKQTFKFDAHSGIYIVRTKTNRGNSYSDKMIIK